MPWALSHRARYGDLMVCRIIKCDKPVVDADRLCAFHVEKRDRPSYTAAHLRVRKERGRPSEHPCAGGCGRQAEHWSYNHRDPNEIVGPAGGSRKDRRPLICAYSADPAFYDPLCRRCHVARDKTVSVTFILRLLEAYREEHPELVEEIVQAVHERGAST